MNAIIKSIPLPRIRIILGINIPSVRRAVARDLNDYRIVSSASEMIYALWLRIDTSWLKRLQQLFIKSSAITKLPITRNDGCHSIIPMRVGLDCCVRGNKQEDRVIKLRGVGVRDHQANVVSDYSCFLHTKRLYERVDSSGCILHIQSVTRNIRITDPREVAR